MKSRILFIAVVAIYFSAIYLPVRGQELCPIENCVTPKKCEQANVAHGCGSAKICCSVIKSEFRTHCRHHGGECTSSWCNPRIIARNVIDCPYPTQCCILV